MNILGLGGALGHDAAAAVLCDEVVVAAAEEERFSRKKHAPGALPEAAARYCLDAAKLTGRDIDCVAIPYAPIGLLRPDRWQTARGYWYAPDRTVDALLNGNRRYRRFERRIRALGAQLGIDWRRTRLAPVEHHLAHASSAYHLSGFDGPTAILGIDGKGEYATTFLGQGVDGRIEPIGSSYDPHSLSGLYGALTQYLGFDMLDGEYKVMGMACYGNPDAITLDHLVAVTAAGVRVDTARVNTVGLRRYKRNGRGYYFGKRLVDELGEPRPATFDSGPVEQRFLDVAAATQALFERRALELVDRFLAPILADGGRLAFAGGGALNVKLNQRLLARPDVKRLFVQPAAGDAGTALGAATYVAAGAGVRFPEQRHCFFGPAFSSDACEAALAPRLAGGTLCARRMNDPVTEAADLITAGHPLAWFQGPMEFGPRALGARSILANPATPGIADRINAQIKFRETWRPFCPSLLDAQATAMLKMDHPAPFMTLTFDIDDEWRARVPEVVHIDGTARVQVVTADAHPRYHALLDAMRARTGVGVLLNTSLNRRGEPIVATPDDALAMFLGCDLRYLMLEDWLVTKPKDSGTERAEAMADA
ncbi:MAG: carbamoyltransferase C-terminal domain-containing protein [Pseudomonadota bacterium]